MKSENKLSEAMQLIAYNTNESNKIAMERINELIHEFLMDNAPTPKCGRSLYDVCIKEKKAAHPNLTGVYHDADGWAVACDGHIIVATREDYKAEFAGKIIDRYGKEIEGYIYPAWSKVVDFSERADRYEVSLPSEETMLRLGKEFAAYKKEMEMQGCKKSEKSLDVRVGGWWFNYELLNKMRKWTDKATQVRNELRGMQFISDDVICLLMPLTPQNYMEKAPDDCIAILHYYDDNVKYLK